MKAPFILRPRVKICGIAGAEDAEAAVRLGADALGFVFHEPSPRHVHPETVREIVRSLPPLVNAVGVFVDMDREKVLETARRCLLDTVQLHGDESPEYCAGIQEFFRVIKAVRIRDKESLAEIGRHGRVNGVLLDSYSREAHGGSGKKFDWALARSAAEGGRIILAGGLTPGNVGEAIREVRPCGVDVSSGVEKEPGKKDHEKLAAFFRAVDAAWRP